MKNALLLLIIIALPQLLSSQDLQDMQTLSAGYQFSSRNSYLNISYELKSWISEGRIFVNNHKGNSPDVEFFTGYEFLKYQDSKIYAGVGAQMDISASFNTYHLTLPVGIFFHPIANQKFGIQMELSPVAADISWGRGSYMRGSIGIRYKIQGNRKISLNRKNARDSLIIDPARAGYITLFGPGLLPGYQQSWFANNFEWHIGALVALPFGLYGGVNYHFIRKNRNPEFHLYTGMDLGSGWWIGYYDSIKLILYAPLGLQYISASGFTMSLEAAYFMNPDGISQPWGGIKIGRTIMHK